MGEPCLETLTRANLDDLLEALGLPRDNPISRAVEVLCRPVARQFARRVAEYDRLVGIAGLQLGARWAVARLADHLELAGAEHLPARGPLLVVANHPGVGDTVALCSSIPRPDLRIVAVARPFLRALPHTSRHLIELPPDGPGRLAVVHQVVEHLRSGGAVLAFPAGGIEPDPARSAEAIAGLKRWSRSIGLFACRAPGTCIVPAIVSGVLSPAALRNPLTRLRRHSVNRERLGATIQIVGGTTRDVTVRVAYGPALHTAAESPSTSRAATVQGTVIAAALALLVRPPEHWERLF